MLILESINIKLQKEKYFQMQRDIITPYKAQTNKIQNKQDENQERQQIISYSSGQQSDHQKLQGCQDVTKNSNVLINPINKTIQNKILFSNQKNSCQIQSREKTQQKKENALLEGTRSNQLIKKIQVQKKETIDQDEWAYESENDGQQNKYFRTYEQSDQQNEQTAVYDDDQMKNLTNQNMQSIQNQEVLNEGMLQKQMSVVYEHPVQNKFLLVLYLLYRKQIFAMFPKEKYNGIDIHPANKNKIKIFGVNKQEIKTVSLKISQLISQISIVKLNIRNQQALKMKSSRLLNKKLLKDKMIIFRFGYGNDKSYYLGGKGTQPYLSSVFKQIRNYKYKYFRMFNYCNTRSYKIILSYIVKKPDIYKAFENLNLKSLQLVNFIPNFSNNYQSKKQIEKNVCLLLTTLGNFDTFSPKQLQNNLSTYIKNQFNCIILIFKQKQNYLPKLNVEDIKFKYISQRKFNRAYIYIMSTKKDFMDKRQEIITQIQKLAEKNLIYGARYFKNIPPQITEYIKPDNYKVIPFPKQKPYSYSIMTRRIIEEGENKDNCQMIEKEGYKSTLKQYRFYEFDWRTHLRNIQSTEISFIQEKCD